MTYATKLVSAFKFQTICFF